jgi:hypothetical protein
MRNEAARPNGGLPVPDWQEALDELERSLRDASWAITLLRRALEEDAPAVRPMRPVRADRPPPADEDGAYDVPALARPAKVVPAPEAGEALPADDGSYGRSTFERLWDRIELERMEKEPAEAASGAEVRGLDLLPQQYLMTVEDRESRVDLVPLHRALLNVAVMEDVSLVSYANGVPVISVRLQGELDLDRLQKAVATAMDRDCEVIQQENNKLFLRLTSRANPEAEHE